MLKEFCAMNYLSKARLWVEEVKCKVGGHKMFLKE